MAKEKISYETFLEAVDLPCRAAVDEINALMSQHGCKLGIEPAKSGYVVSYKHPAGGRTVFNFVFRKTGLHARLYADQVGSYVDLVAALPPPALEKLDKAPACKRLLDFTACSSTCSMGYDFELNGKRYQKCRYNAFLMPMTDENIPHITAMVARELAERSA